MSDAVILNPGETRLGELRAIWSGAGVDLDAAAWRAVDAGADSIGRIVASGKTVYGVNTGFGLLAQTRIDDGRLAELQRNLVMSHACGLGPDLSREIVRLLMALKVIGLARGYSGASRAVIRQLLSMLEREAIPCIPAQGSVGASGDLAPLAHLTAAMMGVGKIAVKGVAMPAAEALAKVDLAPLALGPKEGLALLNGTQVSTAIALDALFVARNVFASALVAGALSVDALQGSDAPFDPRLNALRGQPGQIRVAAFLKAAMEGSEIRRSHIECDRVQDPYSFRCQPQVMGACLDLLEAAARTLEIESNAVSDNPIIFPDTDEAVSGGNFHAQPVAFAADQIVMAMCEAGSISERRIAVLVDPKMSGMPAFLVEDGGVNSGFMIPQVTAAALVAENRSLAFPASVDSVPTSANQEDHVSMATGAARKADQVARNAAGVIAVELMAAAQGIDFHAPCKTSPALQDVHALIRQQTAFLARDRYLADEMASLRKIVAAGELLSSPAVARLSGALFSA
ncbi:histidine ammonia-lyase [Amphiplicatus metriothermophilus]|uniref:Histidine ammonia-lyase n=1 Tax=Amphiplicatus metriothermophilus TaxID=1519374 RepID=A0A239PYY7_9PROT|nr:histidine ammonia-lyase [Amphiplicatus metriothermophilus]MBB5519765.1 histidine ammonia-lyase [Amphiplicatus metriothermophilus]SNT75233.1 histidine ammonia-lyase [Amphiplicatus metriothermophilus]